MVVSGVIGSVGGWKWLVCGSCDGAQVVLVIDDVMRLFWVVMGVGVVVGGGWCFCYFGAGLLHYIISGPVKLQLPVSSSRVRHNGERVSAAVLAPVPIWLIVIMLKPAT